MLIGGGFGLFLCARDGDDPQLLAVACWPLFEDCVLLLDEDDVVIFVEFVVAVSELEETILLESMFDEGLIRFGDDEALDDEGVEACCWLVAVVVAVQLALFVAVVRLLLLLSRIISEQIIELLFTSEAPLGEVGGEVEVGEAEAELELATELQLPVLRDKSVGSFSLPAAEAAG